ncbi:hypothetical protein ACVWXL_008279 [Bradyrhizobium sp. GM22.5]
MEAFLQSKSSWRHRWSDRLRKGATKGGVVYPSPSSIALAWSQFDNYLIFYQGDPCTMNAPFERSPKPDLSLEEGALGEAFGALAKSQYFTPEYAEKVRDSFGKLVVRLDPAQVRWDNYELALQQLDGLRDFLWGGVDPIVRLMTPCSEASGTAMQGNNMESWLDIACDEKTIKGHKKLIRRALEGETSEIVSLQELANDIYNPKTQKKKNEDYRDKLRDETLYPMADLGLWRFVEEIKKSKAGNNYHAGFRISAGLVLMAFHKQIWLRYSEYYTKLAHILRAGGDEAS